MIKIKETPQLAPYTYTYDITGDILTITMNDKVEVFDFTDLPDGIAESIELEVLPVNPVVSIEKAGEIIEVTLIRFYDSDEKEVFENGED